MKYRIVKRRVDRYYFHYAYYAQINIWGIWIDLKYHPFVDAYNAYDMDFDTVERWLKDYIEGKKPVNEEVVKTYD
jgi:hypothetical protein